MKLRINKNNLICMDINFFIVYMFISHILLLIILWFIISLGVALK